MLNFIGCGSALNTSLGNNCAYIRRENELFLIDCGSSVFSRLQQYKVLDGIEKINVLLTHTHPDHIGSLGDLIFYTYYILKNKTRILTPDIENIQKLLELMGVDADHYQMYNISKNNIVDVAHTTIKIHTIPVSHVKTLNCYGYILEIDNKQIYYSGDANAIPEKVLQLLKCGKLNYLYQETCRQDYENNPHMSLQKLCDQLEPEYRDSVYCMHYDEDFDFDEAIKQGFNLVGNCFEKHDF